MADKLSVSRQQYCNMENGKAEKISAKQKSLLSELLDLPEDQVDLKGKVIPLRMWQDNRSSFTLKDNLLTELLTELIAQNKMLLQVLEKLADSLNPERA